MYSAAAGWLDVMFLNVCSFDLAYGSSRVSCEFDEIITMMRVGCWNHYLYCIIVYFSLSSVSICLICLGALMFGTYEAYIYMIIIYIIYIIYIYIYIYIHNCHIILMDWLLYHYRITSFVSCYQPSAPSANTSDSSSTGSYKAPETPGAQVVSVRVWTTLLTQTMEGRKCRFSNIARGSTGKKNQKLVLYCHLLKNKKNGL